MNVEMGVMADWNECKGSTPITDDRAWFMQNEKSMFHVQYCKAAIIIVTCFECHDVMLVDRIRLHETMIFIVVKIKSGYALLANNRRLGKYVNTIIRIEVYAFCGMTLNTRSASSAWAGRRSPDGAARP